jgi:hypothetical protein
MSANLAVPQIVSAALDAAAPCPATTDVRVNVVAAGSGDPTDAPFTLHVEPL